MCSLTSYLALCSPEHFSQCLLYKLPLLSIAKSQFPKLPSLPSREDGKEKYLRKVCDHHEGPHTKGPGSILLLSPSEWRLILERIQPQWPLAPRRAQIRPGIVVEPHRSQDGNTDNPLLFNTELESLGDKLEKKERGSGGERRPV